MSDSKHALQDAFMASFSRELKSWDRDSGDQGRAWLIKRCKAVEKQLSVDIPTHFWRRAVVAPMLLAADPEAFEPRWDPVLTAFCSGISTVALKAIKPHIIAIVQSLPETRRAAPLDALLDRSRDVVEGSGSLHLMIKSPRAVELAIEDTEALATEDRGDTDFGNDLVRAIWLVSEQTGGSIPEHLDPTLIKAINLWCSNKWHGTGRRLKGLLDCLSLERREKILTKTSIESWPLFKSCPTGPLRERALEVLRRKSLFQYRERTLEIVLEAFCPDIVPGLLGVLEGGGLNRETTLIIMRSLAKHPLPSCAAAFEQHLAHEHLPVAALALAGLDTLGPEISAKAIRSATQARREALKLAAEAIERRWRGERRTLSPDRAFEMLSEHIKVRQVSTALSMFLERHTSGDSLWLHWPLVLRMDLAVTGWLLDNWLKHIVPGGRMRERFMEALAWHREDDVYMAAALWVIDVPFDWTNDIHADKMAWLDACAELFGAERFAPFVRYAIIDGPTRNRVDIYTWFHAREMADDALHMAAIAHKSENARLIAIRALAAKDTAPRPRILDNLKDKKGHVRMGAAHYLRMLQHADALPYLEAALEKERSKKVQEALRAARTACDPFMRSLQVRERSYGGYKPGDTLELSDAIEQLRGLMYDSPSELSWWRVCDLLERLRGKDGLSVALDYLNDNGISRWPLDLRARPWDWSKHDALAAISKENESILPWTPIATFMEGRHKDYLADRLSTVEVGVRARLFSPELCALFADWVGRGLAWCESQGISPVALEIRVDGGSVRKNHVMRAETTALHLTHGFGAIVSRTSARKETPKQGPGLRLARIKVPSKHPIREELAMNRRKPFLDLIPILSSEDTP